MTGENGTLEYRVAALEKNYDTLDLKIDILLQNHLPHIQSEIVSLKTRVTVTAFINVGAIIIGIIISNLF